MQYCLAIPFFDKHNLFCMRQCKTSAQLENLQLVAWTTTEKRDFWSCVLHWSKTAPCFLAVNSIGLWFNYFLRSANHGGIKHGGIIPICYDGNYCYHFYSYTRNRFYWATFKLEDINRPKFCRITFFICHYTDLGNGESRPRTGLFIPFKNKFQLQLVYITYMMDINST